MIMNASGKSRRLRYHMWRVGRGREPWERSEAGGVNDNERHLRHSSHHTLVLSLVFAEEMKSATRTRHLRSCGCACLHVSYGLYSLIWEYLFSTWIGSFESRYFALYTYVFISVRQVFTEFHAHVHRDQDGRKRLVCFHYFTKVVIFLTDSGSF